MTTSDFDAPAASTALPALHGEGDDPRYPSPRELRQVFAFLFDWCLHVAVGVVATLVCLDIPAVGDWAALALPVGWLVASLLQRVVAQRIFHATLGKALMGLCVIRPSDGSWPTLGYLLKWWLIGAFDALSTISNSPWLGSYDNSPSVVRRRDVVALHDAP